MNTFTKTFARHYILLGVFFIAVLTTLAGVTSSSTFFDEAQPKSTLNEKVYSDGSKMGAIKVFSYKNVIDLKSDRRNLSVASHVQLPSGWVIEEAYFDVHKKKHTVKYSLKVDQPNSVSIAQSSLIKISRAADSATGFFSGKKKNKLAGDIKRSTESLHHSVVLDATSHARVSYKGWADGRRWSSRDGVIKASLIVKARRAPTASEINAELAAIAVKMLDSNATILEQTVQSLLAIKKAVKAAKKAKNA